MGGKRFIHTGRWVGRWVGKYLEEGLADGEHAIELGGREGTVQEEATDNVGKALPEEHGEEHEFIVEDED